MADDEKCTPQSRRNQAQELLEVGTTPNVDTEAYGTIPLESPAFSCLSEEERKTIVDALLKDKLVH